MKASAVAQQPLTMSRVLLYCPRGYRATFVHSVQSRQDPQLNSHEEATQLVTAGVWLAAVTRSEKFENGYWTSDNIHEPVYPIIINNHQ